MKYLLLDYDGFMAKSYYASKSKDNDTQDTPIDILLDLEESSIKKAREYFGEDEEIIVLKITSGHSYKKDIFPGYKGKRKRDEEFGEFREYVKENFDITLADNLEADDLITLINDLTDQECLVISDDKDLRYYNRLVSKINPTEPIIEQDFTVMAENKYIQMIEGDSIDCIKGIPRKGEVWSRKYLDKNGYSIESVIKAYKESGVDVDECLKNLVEVIPLNFYFLKDEYHKFAIDLLHNSGDKYSNTMKVIEGFIRSLSENIKEIYYNDSKSKKDNEEGT